MSSSSSENTDSGSAETPRVLLHRRDQWYNNNTWTSFRRGLLKLKSLCGFSKAVFFILTWTLIVGAIYAAMLFFSSRIHSHFSWITFKYFLSTTIFSYPYYALHRLCRLALAAVLYPLSGFLADIWCGRLKTVMVGLFCLLFSTIISVFIPVWFIKEHRFNHDIFGFNDHNSKYCTTLYNWCVFVPIRVS